MKWLKTVLRRMRIFCDEAEFLRDRWQASERTEILGEAAPHNITFLLQLVAHPVGSTLPKSADGSKL